MIRFFQRALAQSTRLGRIELTLARLERKLDQLAAGQSSYLGDHTALTFLRGGPRIYVDTRSVDIGSHVLTHGIWEEEYTTLFQRLIRPGATVLDIGANIGVYTLRAAAAAGPLGKVHAFEANPRLAELTRRSIHINGFESFCQVHCLAVADRRGEARLVFSHAWSGGGSLFRHEQDLAARGEEAVLCPMLPLDDLFPAASFRADVIKIDIEGAEGQALRGMRQLLERSPELRLMMEFSPDMLAGAGTPPQEVAELLGGMGLRPWLINQAAALTETNWPAVLASAVPLQNILLSRQAPF